MNVTTPELEDFYNALKGGLESIERAGKILVALQVKNPGIKDQILDANPTWSRSILDRLEDIGNGRLLVRLLMDERPGCKALRKCRASDQERYLVEPIDVGSFVDGSFQIRKLRVEDLTGEQCKVVFSGSRIRSLAEQRSILERSSSSLPLIEVDQAFRIRRGAIEILRPCIIKKSILKNLIKEI